MQCVHKQEINIYWNDYKSKKEGIVCMYTGANTETHRHTHTHEHLSCGIWTGGSMCVYEMLKISRTHQNSHS